MRDCGLHISRHYMKCTSIELSDNENATGKHVDLSGTWKKEQGTTS